MLIFQPGDCQLESRVQSLLLLLYCPKISVRCSFGTNGNGMKLFTATANDACTVVLYSAKAARYCVNDVSIVWRALSIAILWWSILTLM